MSEATYLLDQAKRIRSFAAGLNHQPTIDALLATALEFTEEADLLASCREDGC